MPSPRTDLSRSAVLWVLGLSVAGSLGVMLFARAELPGTPVRQCAAILGALALLVPALFSVAKRSGLSSNPPLWFVAHVLCGALGAVLVLFHAAGGDLISAPGALLVAVGFVVVQGALARVLLSPSLANRFAASPSFTRVDSARRAAILEVIAAKQALLPSIDVGASEALFSPTLAHWLRHPIRCIRYQRLAAHEAQLVGARARSGALLSRWRLAHMVVAVTLVLGMVVHVLVVTFFAGYVAGEQPVYWWHLAEWGRP